MEGCHPNTSQKLWNFVRITLSKVGCSFLVWFLSFLLSDCTCTIKKENTYFDRFTSTHNKSINAISRFRFLFHGSGSYLTVPPSYLTVPCPLFHGSKLSNCLLFPLATIDFVQVSWNVTGKCHNPSGRADFVLDIIKNTDMFRSDAISSCWKACVRSTLLRHTHPCQGLLSDRSNHSLRSLFD